MKKLAYPLVLILVLCALTLSACQPATEIAQNTPLPTETSVPTKVVELWQVSGDPKAPVLTLLVGFNDASHGIAVGEDGEVSYTLDGGLTWVKSNNESMGLYGLEMVNNQVACACGNGNSIRLTADGGANWQVGTNFGAGFPNHCRFLSFLDAQTGWAATPTILGTTADGGTTWTNASLPDGVTGIAAISLFATGQGYLLDIVGALHITSDNGLTWFQAGTLPLGNITIASKSYPLAAMHFQDARRGMIVVSALVDGAGLVTAFHTADGGQTWTQETIPATYGAPYISRDGRFLTLLMPPTKLTVLQYNGE